MTPPVKDVVLAQTLRSRDRTSRWLNRSVVINFEDSLAILAIENDETFIYSAVSPRCEHLSSGCDMYRRPIGRAKL
jgi:hypothetical protein